MNGNSRKGTSLHLRKAFHDALRLLKEKYGASATQVFEALLERDLLLNEPEIAEQVGVVAKPPNRFASGFTGNNEHSAYTQVPVPYELPPPRAGVTSAWGEGAMMVPPISSASEVPPSQRVR